MRRFRKKVRRFVRLYWFWVSLGLVLTKVSVEAAYIERGYKAYGGEWLVLPVVMIVGYFVNEARMYLPDFIEEWREEKAYERTIGLEHIHPHPDNPRKDLGDLTELAESIKKNGIMQNLTVIPKEGEPGEYITIIGHRRSAAAKLAGVTEAPCRVVEDMTDKEQMSTMLEENMQRNDLTIWEQAQGFQMMLDLGETEDTIAEKTGFSKKTIRHRLNIAKLDSKTLMEKERQDGYQLSLTDLYELEKIKDVKTREDRFTTSEAITEKREVSSGGAPSGYSVKR